MNRDNCANCQPGQACRIHRTVADGEVVRVPLAMMDSMQREVADREPANDQSERYAAAIKDSENKGARIQAYADHYREQRAIEEKEFEARATPSERAYRDSCDALQYRGRA